MTPGRSDPGGPVEPHPTPFPELDALVVELVERARSILGSSFVGAYLQGSVALGDQDPSSDCDFLIPVHGPISADQEAALRLLHDELPLRPGHWSTELEGSYPEVTELRSVTSLGRPWLYVDRGHREMAWSTHCNTEVVRWILRERVRRRHLLPDAADPGHRRGELQATTAAVGPGDAGAEAGTAAHPGPRGPPAAAGRPARAGSVAATLELALRGTPGRGGAPALAGALTAGQASPAGAPASVASSGATGTSSAA